MRSKTMSRDVLAKTIQRKLGYWQQVGEWALKVGQTPTVAKAAMHVRRLTYKLVSYEKTGKFRSRRRGT